MTAGQPQSSPPSPSPAAGFCEPCDLAPVLQTLQEQFSQLKQRLLDSNVKDFGLDKDCDWSATSAQGALHQSQAALLLGSLEAMIEDVVAEATGSM